MLARMIILFWACSPISSNIFQFAIHSWSHIKPHHSNIEAQLRSVTKWGTSSLWTCLSLWMYKYYDENHYFEGVYILRLYLICAGTEEAIYTFNRSVEHMRQFYQVSEATLFSVQFCMHINWKKSPLGTYEVPNHQCVLSSNNFVHGERWVNINVNFLVFD